MENGFGDEERRTVPATMMENGDVYVAFGAHRVKPCITTI